MILLAKNEEMDFVQKEVILQVFFSDVFRLS